MNNKYYRFVTTLIAIAASSALMNCSHFPGAYTLPIKQGNEINAHNIEQLAAGMNEEQVRFLLGTPLIKDVFHPNRWDYVYSFKEKYTLKEENYLVVHFEDGMVTHFEPRYSLQNGD